MFSLNVTSNQCAYINAEECISCGACAEACGLSLIWQCGVCDKYYVLDIGECNQCNGCIDVCPVGCIDYYPETLDPNCYHVWIKMIIKGKDGFDEDSYSSEYESSFLCLSYYCWSLKSFNI